MSIISNVTVHVIKEPQGKTVAFVRMTIGDCLQLTNMRLVEGANGLFLAFPNDPSNKGEDYKSIFYPITKDMREEMTSIAIEKYEMAVRKKDDLPF